MKDGLEMLIVVIPELPATSGYVHHPISRSASPKMYRPDELMDSGEAHTAWLGYFEEFLLGLYWKLRKPVPFAFKTADGTVRSLDAGCLKWLSNRNPPAVHFQLDRSRRIAAVEPSLELQAKYEARKDELISLVSWKPKKA